MGQMFAFNLKKESSHLFLIGSFALKEFAKMKSDQCLH